MCMRIIIVVLLMTFVILVYWKAITGCHLIQCQSHSEDTFSVSWLVTVIFSNEFPILLRQISKYLYIPENRLMKLLRQLFHPLRTHQCGIYNSGGEFHFGSLPSI